jgi:hypothetical protein
VDEKYVSPTAEVLDKIRRESRRVGGIFSAVKPERLWRASFRRPVPGEVISGFGKRSIARRDSAPAGASTSFS